MRVQIDQAGHAGVLAKVDDLGAGRNRAVPVPTELMRSPSTTTTASVVTSIRPTACRIESLSSAPAPVR